MEWAPSTAAAISASLSWRPFAPRIKSWPADWVAKLNIPGSSASVDIASILPGRASGIVADATGTTLTRDEIDRLCAALSKSRRVSPADQQNNLEGTLGAVLGNHSGIGWTGTTHTSDYTVLTALGPGAAEFAGLLPNTEVFAILTHLPGIRFVNGTSTPDAAVLAAASREPSSRPHWV